ncbi:hypothetical protein [Novosphingobium sp.]|uniref:hypothetical protein n=1 Tax=Novosphingobium sp. TaxID=1874826 RepID=UPI00333EC822
MTLSRNLAAFLGIGAMALSTAAQAQQDTCISAAELDSMLRYSLADVIDGAATACRPTLGTAAFLASDGPALIQRYRVAQPEAWPAARHGLMKVTGADGEKDKMAGLMSKLPDEALKPFVSGLIKQMVSGAVKPKDCATVDQTVRLLAPLPVENMAGLLTLIVQRVDKPTADKKQRLPLCRIEPVLPGFPAAPGH